MPAASAKNAKFRILIVDDHPIVRQGLTEILNHQPDLAVCGTAEDAPRAMEAVERLNPHLVIADISLRGVNGLELLKDLKARFPKLFVLMLSMHDEALYAVRALRAGASGYIMKEEATDKIVAAIHRILQGEIFLSERMERRMMHQFLGARTARTGSPIEDLSDRELEVFGLIGRGHGTRQIAEELHLSVKTVESHRAHIKEKLNLKSATELVQHAVQWREI